MSIDIDGLRGDGKGLVLYFIRAANCPVCLRHVKSLDNLGLTARGVAGAVVVPGGPAEAAKVRRIAGGLAVVSSDGVAAHRAAGLNRTLVMQHSGTLLFDATGRETYRLTTTMPMGSFDAGALEAAIDRL
ncbi:hypothetical protein ACQP00_00410 [Dactylosporangium sp. CS-047395]|uniref:hypothetical protein n=1 Tax=Dactylosporangium sp. CS-047395 TaxID=3239936 RepID=UPI003D90C21C